LTAGEEDPLIGAIAAGRYRIGRRIGEGGMGAVYQAHDLQEDRRVALKCLHAHLAKQKDVVARFRREAFAATRAGNEHIVEVTDVGELEDGSAFMVLEYLEGRDLASELSASGPLTVGRAVHVVQQMCDALYVVHDKGIIHRDLKPENVFLIERGGDPFFVKVLDFGISKVRAAADGEVTAMTRTGTTVGTPYYMAPEQAQARKDIDHRVDVYALGVILFRALTREHPFDDESYPMLVLKICTEPPPPVRRYRSDVPPELEAVIERMLAKDPAARFTDARAVREALVPFMGRNEPPVLTGAPGTREASPSALSGGAVRVDSPLARAETAPAQAMPAGPWQSGPLAAGPPSPPDDEDTPAPVVRGARTPALMPWVLLAAGLSTIGLLAVIALTAERDEPIDTGPELPEPAPPRTKALVAPGQGGVGWMWVNPLPRAMPTWYDVDVAGQDLVAMVGFAGEAARFQKGTMYRWRTGTDVSLHGVAWSSPREAIAVGDAGEIRVLRLEGETLVVPSGTTFALRSVLATSPTEAWITGDAGTLLRLSAYRADPLETGTEMDLLAVQGRGEKLWVVGEAGTILRVEGEVVTPETSGTEATLRAVGGCSDGDLYAAGDEGRLLRRRADGRWEILQHDHREPWAAIACDRSRNRAVAAGLRGGVLLVAGTRSVRLESGTDRSLHGVSATRGSDTWIVGDGGRLMKLMDDHVRTLTSGPTSAIQDLGAIGGALVAVGEWGRILREQRQGFAEARSPTKAALAAVAPLGEQGLVAAGDYGAVVSIGWDRAELVESPSGHSWRDVVSDGRVVLGVGTDGGILRGAPGAFSVSRVPHAGTLWAVAGDPEDAIAAGDAGLIVRLAGGGTQRIACDVDVSLRGVVRTGERAWAVGERGTIVRVDDRACVVERPPRADEPTLNGIGLGPYGRPLAVGNRGIVLERDDASTWQPVDIDAGRNNLRAVFRSDRDAYIAGAGGVILRHVRLDAP
jgi:serine/threonine-protein kinase